MAKGSFTGELRQAARNLGTFTAAGISEALKIQTYEGMKKLRSVIHDMRKSGEIASIERGVYQYVEGVSDGRKSDVAERVYRAMHVKGMFTATEISFLSDADGSYVRSLIRKLKNHSEIEQMGTRRIQGRPVAVFRVKDRDRFYKEYVHQGGG
ncbi:MAG: hypothetical protein JRJ66_02255 [Deltaproteobacteria bacterium]|nr:hypothetical protein [Deltaproteobacteria bacterium]